MGRSEAGKTTLLEGLIAELKRRGYRLAVVKHDVHGFELDQPGKDSWRLAKAGSDAVGLSSPDKLALIQRMDHDLSLGELSRFISLDYDLILTEGFKQDKAAKVEVHRRGLGELLCRPEQLLAVVSDEPLDLDLPQFTPEDVAGLAGLLERRFLARDRDEKVALFINGLPVLLNPFVRGFLSRTLLGMVSALKGVESVEALDISLRRKA